MGLFQKLHVACAVAIDQVGALHNNAIDVSACFGNLTCFVPRLGDAHLGPRGEVRASRYGDGSPTPCHACITGTSPRMLMHCVPYALAVASAALWQRLCVHAPLIAGSSQKCSTHDRCR